MNPFEELKLAKNASMTIGYRNGLHIEVEYDKPQSKHISIQIEQTGTLHFYDFDSGTTQGVINAIKYMMCTNLEPDFEMQFENGVAQRKYGVFHLEYKGIPQEESIDTFLQPLRDSNVMAGLEDLFTED